MFNDFTDEVVEYTHCYHFSIKQAQYLFEVSDLFFLLNAVKAVREVEYGAHLGPHIFIRFDVQSLTAYLSGKAKVKRIITAKLKKMP